MPAAEPFNSATCPPTLPPARRGSGHPGSGDTRVRGHGVRGGASVGARDWTWTGEWGRTDSPLAPHQPPPARARRASGEASGAGAAARHMQAGGSRAGASWNAGTGSSPGSGSHARFVSTRRIIAAAVELFGFTVASLGFSFFFLYYSELYCEGSPMALMQIFRLCVVSFFFLVMLMHTVRVYVYALGWPSSF